MKKYRKRVADEILKRKLEGKGAVLIEGPKWCGKTTTAEQFSASVLYMDDPERKEQNITMSELNPRRLLNGAVPRLIDEWQLAPKLWDAILILSRLVDTFISRISLTMLPVPKPHNTACVLSWEEARRWQSRSSGYSSS